LGCLSRALHHAKPPADRMSYQPKDCAAHNQPEEPELRLVRSEGECGNSDRRHNHAIPTSYALLGRLRLTSHVVLGRGIHRESWQHRKRLYLPPYRGEVATGGSSAGRSRSALRKKCRPPGLVTFTPRTLSQMRRVFVVERLWT